MRTLRRAAALLLFPAIAYVGAACEREAPTETPPHVVASVGGPSCSVPGDYTTIQAAVNDPGCTTINVAAGAYAENVVINRLVTLNGAQAGMDARGRVASEATVTPANPLVRTLELQTGSAGSIIDGFTFFGGTRAIESTTGPIDGLQLLNNRILGFSGSGVFLNDNGINITVNQNDIDGTAKVGAGDLFHLDTDNFDGLWFTNNRVANGATATAFFVDGVRNVDKSSVGARTPQFSGNLIDRNQTGVNLGSRAWGDGPITGNTFSNNLFDGLQGGPKNSAISQNTFSNNGRNGLALTSFGNTTDPARGAQGNSITQNCFTGNGFLQAGAGLFFSATQFPGTISSNVANQNNISGNLTGAQYLGTETINAELNWWGSPTGPFHPTSNLTGTGNPVVDDGDGIDFIPFLTLPAGGTPCTPPPSGKVTGGGQVQVNMSGGRGSFGFNAESDAGVGSGHLNYLNHVSGAHLDCTVTTVTALTATAADFSGTCSSSSAAGSFMAHVEDHATSGRNADKFTITYGTVVDEGGTLISGNIEIHQ